MRSGHCCHNAVDDYGHSPQGARWQILAQYHVDVAVTPQARVHDVDSTFSSGHGVQFVVDGVAD